VNVRGPATMLAPSRRPSGCRWPSTTKTTLNNGTARFTTNVWLGSSYVNKVCQFIQPGTKLTYAYLSVDRIAATMTLRVYDV
jgi:hypothetical protein